MPSEAEQHYQETYAKAAEQAQAETPPVTQWEQYGYTTQEAFLDAVSKAKRRHNKTILVATAMASSLKVVEFVAAGAALLALSKVI